MYRLHRRGVCEEDPGADAGKETDSVPTKGEPLFQADIRGT